MPNFKNNLDKRAADPELDRERLKRKKQIEAKKNAEKALSVAALQNEIIDQENDRVLEEKASDRLPGESDKDYYKRKQAENIKGGGWSGKAKDYGKKQLGKAADSAKRRIAASPKLNKLASAAGNIAGKVNERAEAIKKKKAEFDAKNRAIRDVIKKKLNAAKRIQGRLSAENVIKEEIKRKIKQAIARAAYQIAAAILEALAGVAIYIGIAILIIILIIIIIQAAESFCSDNPLFDFVCSLAGF